MSDENRFESIERTLQLAMVAEIVFLAAAGFFLFTEHKAHYLGALPYAVIIISVTACFWLQAECRKHLTDIQPRTKQNASPKKGVEFHEP